MIDPKETELAKLNLQEFSALQLRVPMCETGFINEMVHVNRIIEIATRLYVASNSKNEGAQDICIAQAKQFYAKILQSVGG